MKLKNSNCVETQKLIGIKLKTSNCDETKKNQIVTKVQIVQNSITQNVTKLKM